MEVRNFLNREAAAGKGLNTRKARLLYLLSFLVLLGIEILIALFVHDEFIRPYIGDVLAVIVLYAAVRIIRPDGIRLLPLYIFVFAAVVETLQYFDLVHILGVENNTIMKVLIGSVFDGKDLVCYGVGCALLGLYLNARKTSSFRARMNSAIFNIS